MDKIIIENLEIYAFHGVFNTEKELGQKFIISVELELDLSKAAESDDLSFSVNYGEVCERIKVIFTEKSFNLIEAAANNLILSIFKEYPLIENVELLLKKPQAPIKQTLDYAAVKLRRSRQK
jgi:dihydroneopterin aldolase